MKKRITSILLITAMVLAMAFSNAVPVYAGPSNGYYGDYGYTATLDEISGKAGYVRFWGWAFNEYRVGCTMPTYVYKWNGSSYQYVTTVNLNRNARGDVQNAYSLGTNYVGFGHNLPLASGYYAFRIHVTGGSYSPMAAWSETTYNGYYVSQPTCTFDKQGGTGGTDSTLVDYGTYTHNSTVTAPSRTGYDFNGYYTGGNGTGAKYFDAAGNMVSTWGFTGGATLYACWTPSSYTVTLNNGGTDITTEGTASKTATYTYDMPQITPPRRTGYTFDGYWTASTGGTRYYNADGTSARTWNIAGDTTLYAHWNVNTYSIRYYDGAEEFSKTSAAKINDTPVKSFTYEDPVALPVDVTKANAIFNGWYESSDLDGDPVFSWGTHTASRTENQTFYADWIDIDGTRADSEKQTFSASLFDAETASYNTAQVLVTLDGEKADVSQVQLKQSGKETLTMAGSDGLYTFTSSADVSGSWDIWVNGADSGVNLTFGTEAAVNMVTATVSVENDGVAAAGCSVVLKNGSGADLTLSESDTAGTYLLQTFADENKTYNIYIDGRKTGKTISLKDSVSCTEDIAFWTVTVNAKKDGSAAHMGAAELRTTGACISLSGLAGTYTLSGIEDETTSYDLYMAGLDTGFDISFTAAGRSCTVNYHTVTVKTYKDGAADVIGNVTLRDGEEIVHTLAPAAGKGVYTICAQENDKVYDIYVDGEDTGTDACFTADGKSPAAIAYYTVKVTVSLDGTAAPVGTVVLKSEEEELTLPSTAAGVYSMTRLADSATEYDIYVAGEPVAQKARFTGVAAEKTRQVDYTTLRLTLNLDGEAADLGDVVLKQKNAADLAMVYDNGSYTAKTWRSGSYDIWLDGADSGNDLKVGKASVIDYYTLSYNLDGGSGNLPADQICQKGTSVELPAEIPVRTDYQFVGWSCDAANADFTPNTAGIYDDPIVISSACHTLTAIWCENSKYEARFQKPGTGEWTYASLQYAVDYAGEHPDCRFTIEVMGSSSLKDGTEIMSNVEMTVPAGVTLGGNFVNRSITNVLGSLSGTVTNYGTICGGCTVAEDDTISGNGQIGTLINKSGATVRSLVIGKVASNAGVLRDVNIASGMGISGSVEGTIFAQSGVLFDDSLFTRYVENTITSQAVISIAGGGTITGTGNMNNAPAFAGLMLDQGDHQMINGIVHLRSKVTVNNNQVYADFFDFTEPAGLVYDKSAKAPAFGSTRTPGIGSITKIMYKQVGGTPAWDGWTQWTETVPVNVGKYQVKIDVAGGDYFAGRASVTDPAVWTFTITPKEAGLTWTAPEDLVYSNSAKVPAAAVNNLETGDSCVVSAAVSEGKENIHVGSFTFTADDLSNKNYKLPENVVSDSYTIVPKPITAQWTVISKDYTGCVLTPDAVLPGIETGDTVSTTFDAGNSKTEAGSYLLTAGLSDVNYVLTNPQTNFTIQKAAVKFTVAEDMQIGDGTAKLPVVTADPDVSFTTYLVDKDGEKLAEASEPGSYQVCATICDENFRFEGRGDGKTVCIGSFIISRGSLPSTYTVSFAKGDGAGGMMGDMSPVKSGDRRILPACTFVKAGFVFAGWKYGNGIYQAGEYFTQPGTDAVLTAQWTEQVYEIGGNVLDADGKVKQGAVVRLMSGSRPMGETLITGEDGSFSFEGVLPGIYNLTVSDDGMVVTTAVVITEKNEADLAISLPGGRTNSVVEVASGTPEVVVSGLDRSFDTVGGNYTAGDKALVDQGGCVEMKLEVVENTSPDEEKRLAAEDLTPNVGMYLDLNLIKTVTDENGVKDTAASGRLYSADTMLSVTIPLPGELQNMSRYTVSRYHKAGELEAENLETLRQVSADDAHTEEGYSVAKDKTSITIYTRSFSLYILGYEKPGQTYRVSLPKTQNGSLTTDLSLTYGAQAGHIVTVYAAPDEGYVLETLRVYDVRGREIALTEVEAGRVYTFRMPSRRVEIKASFVTEESLLGFFEDVYSTDYYYDAVRWAAAGGITGGTDETHFSPRAITTRAQMITFLWNASGKPEARGEMPFADVPADAYYADAVLWAAVNGITSGTGPDTFSPDSNVTRAQAITFLNHYSGTMLGSDVVASTPAVFPFSDVSADAYYRKAVAWASENQITSGTSSDKFSPDADCTRAQVITFLWKALK